MTLPVSLDEEAINSLPRIRSSRVGAVSELIASAHLMKQGFDVFRCVAPHAPFDLVAYREGTLYRVEVKTLSKVTNVLSWAPSADWPSNDEWDLVVVCGLGVTFQFPAGTTRAAAMVTIRKHFGLPLVQPNLGKKRDAGPSATSRVLGIVQEKPLRTWTSRQVRDALEVQEAESPEPLPTCLPTSVGPILINLQKKGLVRKVDGAWRAASESDFPQVGLRPFGIKPNTQTLVCRTLRGTAAHRLDPVSGRTSCGQPVRGGTEYVVIEKVQWCRNCYRQPVETC